MSGYSGVPPQYREILENRSNDASLNINKTVYFIYTFKETGYDQKMKSQERWSINNDISWLENKGITVIVLESATKKELLNAFSDNNAISIITSGHGYDNEEGIQTSDGKSLKPSDILKENVGKSLNTVVFENCWQGDIKSDWESSFENNTNIVSWKGPVRTYETISFNSIGLFDRQPKNLRQILKNSINP